MTDFIHFREEGKQQQQQTERDGILRFRRADSPSRSDCKVRYPPRYRNQDTVLMLPYHHYSTHDTVTNPTPYPFVPPIILSYRIPRLQVGRGQESLWIGQCQRSDDRAQVRCDRCRPRRVARS